MDGGGEFQNELSNEVLVNVLQLIKKGGSPYHPQTQGVNEVRHKKLKQLIRTELYKFADSIEECLPLVQLKMNLGITRRHNSVPFCLFFGRQLNSLPISDNRYSNLTWPQRLALMATVVHPKIKMDMENYFLSAERQYLKKHENQIEKTDFQPGDRVKIRNVQARHVIVKANEPLFKGAFVIKFDNVTRPKAL